jgi:integrase
MSLKGTLTTADYLDYNEFKRLVECLAADKQYKWAFYCIMSFCLGLRSSDVRKLKWGDILDKRSVIVTEKKTQKTKGIPIGEKTMEHIDKMYQLEHRPNLSTYVFESEKVKGKPVSIQYINRLMKIWKKKYKLNIEHFSTHTFRKTFGRYVYEKRNRSTEALMELNRIFRHANLQTTMIYIGITDDNIYKVFNSIDV